MNIILSESVDDDENDESDKKKKSSKPPVKKGSDSSDDFVPMRKRKYDKLLHGKISSDDEKKSKDKRYKNDHLSYC